MTNLKTSLKNLLQPTIIGDLLEQRSIAQWYKSKSQHIPSIEQAINCIQERWTIDVEEDIERPIFIFASSWRSGSTLLQRIVNSDPNTLLWGEPFSDCNLVQNLANSLRSFTDNQPKENYFIKALDDKNCLSKRWTANLYPNIDYLIQSHRSFFHTLYGQSAKEYGCNRWGFKEVRLTVDHAIYLKWLFPKAKFLFLYRNPYKAYQSCYVWRDLYWNWPKEAVYGPKKFGTYWLQQVTDFMEKSDQVNGYLIKYEDLCNRNISVQDIANYLDTELDENILDSKIGSYKNKKPIPKYLLKNLEKVVSPLAEKLDYYL